SRALARPFGARCAPLFLQSGHSHICAASRACACCFAVALLGLMRMESKNLDESIGMTSLTTQSLRLQVLTLQIASIPDATLTLQTKFRFERTVKIHDSSAVLVQ